MRRLALALVALLALAAGAVAWFVFFRLDWEAARAIERHGSRALGRAPRVLFELDVEGRSNLESLRRRARAPRDAAEGRDPPPGPAGGARPGPAPDE
jgi:hypothetical protein